MGSPGLQLGPSPEGSAHGRSYVSLAECSVFVAVEYLHSHASKLRSFIYRPQTGNYRRAHHIERSFLSRNFREALTFVQEIGELAEAEGHHRNISFGWGNMTPIRPHHGRRFR